jgi:Rap1a immunity proteins
VKLNEASAGERRGHNFSVALKGDCATEREHAYRAHGWHREPFPFYHPRYGEESGAGFSMQRLIAAVGLLLFATPAIAGDINVPGFFAADLLYQKCIGPAEGADANQCTGYVAGIADSLEANRVANGLPNCIPPDIPLVRVRQAVTRSLLHYVAENPHVPHSAAGLAAKAITDAWCPTGH